MFSTLRRLLILAAGTITSAMLLAPVAFAVNDGDGAGGPTSTPTTTHPAIAGTSLATWQWTLISIGIVVAVAAAVVVGATVHRRSNQAGTLRPRMR